MKTFFFSIACAGLLSCAPAAAAKPSLPSQEAAYVFSQAENAYHECISAKKEEWALWRAETVLRASVTLRDQRRRSAEKIHWKVILQERLREAERNLDLHWENYLSLGGKADEPESVFPRAEPCRAEKDARAL